MVDSPDTPDPAVAAKRPARVTTVAETRGVGAKKAPARKKPAKKAAAKKAVAKKAPAKKAAAKNAPAKKAPVKKAPAKKAPAKKAAAKKAAAEKAPAKKAPAKKAGATTAPTTKAPDGTSPTERSTSAAGGSGRTSVRRAVAHAAPAARRAAAAAGPAARKAAAAAIPVAKQAAATTRAVVDRGVADGGPVLSLVPDPVEPAVDAAATVTSGLARRSADPSGRVQSDRWALCASITEDLLNDIVLMVVGAGIPLEPLDTTVALPGMGEVDVRLALTVTGGQLDLRADDDGRARVVVRADGEVSTRSATYDGETVEGAEGSAAVGLPTPPAPIPVRVEALVDPFVEFGPDGGSLGLDLRTAQLVSLSTDPDAAVPEGVDAAAWAGILQVFGMVFTVLGAGLFDSLGEHVGRAEVEVPADVAAIVRSLGVAEGSADISVSSGLLTVGLPAAESVKGRALPVPIAGKRVGLGLASSLFDGICQLLIERVAGDLPLPFEIDVDLGEQQVDGRLRQSRLFPVNFPDLRTSLRTEIRPRLLRGRLELSVQSAWVELPPALPSIFNSVSRRLGELVSLAPVRLRLPSTIQLPIIPDSTDTIGIEIDDLRVTADGLGVVIGLA